MQKISKTLLNVDGNRSTLYSLIDKNGTIAADIMKKNHPERENVRRSAMKRINDVAFKSLGPQ